MNPLSRRAYRVLLGAGLLNLALSPRLAWAQPSEQPSAVQRLEEKMKQEQAALRNPATAIPLQIKTCALSPDGQLAVSYRSDGTVTLWDARTGHDVRTFQAHGASQTYVPYQQALFSPDSQSLLTVGTLERKTPQGYDEVSVQTKLWDIKSGDLKWTVLQGPEQSGWETIVFSPDGSLLAAKARLGPVALYQARTGKFLRTLPTPQLSMAALAFSPDGRTLAGGGSFYPSYSSEIVLWNVASGQVQGSWKQPDAGLGLEVQGVVFSPDGRTLALAGGAGKSERINQDSSRFNTQYGLIQLWDVSSGVLMQSLSGMVHRQDVTTLAFSPDGARLATGSLDQTVGLWDAASGDWIGNVTRYGHEVVFENDSRAPKEPQGVGVRDLRFSSDGKTLHVLSTDKAVRDWDVSPLKPASDTLRRMVPERASSVAFSPNGHAIATGGYQQYVRLWDASSTEELDAFLAHDSAVGKVAFAPFAPNEFRFSDQPPLLASASNLMQWIITGENSGGETVSGFEVKLWNSRSHELKARFSVPGYALAGLKMSPGGRYVAALGARNTPPPPGGVAVGGGIGIAVDNKPGDPVPPGVASIGEGVLVWWDTLTGEVKAKVPLKSALPYDLAFSPDGNTLACDGGRAGVTLWNPATCASIRTLGEDLPQLKPGAMMFSSAIGFDGESTLAFTGDGTRLARSYKDAVQFWNPATGELLSTLPLPDPEDGDSTPSIALSPDGKTLFTANIMRPLQAWNTSTGQVMWKSPEQGGARLLALSPDGKTLASNGERGLHLWDVSEAAQGAMK